jgi:glycosyltransferase involved in cell wall biosynthesis
VPAKRIVVTPYGISEVFRSAPAEAGRGRELLFVGTFEARKGLDVLLEAWQRLARDDLGLRLAGAPGWGAESELAALAALPRVQLERSPSDERLAELYRGAAALVHPSRMEGFGLPVAEAMASACPVVSSDLPSVREYAGDAVRFVPRGDAAALAAALGEVMDDAPARRGMAERGRDAVTGLTWEATAEGTAAAIEAAAGGSA